MTPLHVAAERAHNDVMEVLHKHGAKVRLMLDVRARAAQALAANRPAASLMVCQNIYVNDCPRSLT